VEKPIESHNINKEVGDDQTERSLEDISLDFKMEL